MPRSQRSLPLMATVSRRPTIGPHSRGRKMTLSRFMKADFQEGWLYELARGVVVVTEVPGVPHGRIVLRLARLFMRYEDAHPGTINYQAGGGECRIRLPGMQSDRHPDQAVYLSPPPDDNPSVWARWVPDLVVEVVSRGSKTRDLVEKREEYLRAGVREYWVLDPKTRRLHVFARAGDTWEETVVPPNGSHRPRFLPGLVVAPAALLDPA